LDGIDEIVREFLIESNENLDQLDQDLVALESDPGSRELLGSVFRTIHTIKGTSGFLALSNLESVAHVGENLLVELRDGKRNMDQRTTDVLLLMVDTIRSLLTRLDASGTEDGVDVAPAIAEIQAALDNKPSPRAAAKAVEPQAQAPSTPAPTPTVAPAETPQSDDSKETGTMGDEINEDSATGIVPRPSIGSGAPAAAPAGQVEKPAQTAPAAPAPVVSEVEQPAPAASSPSIAPQANTNNQAPGAPSRSTADSSIRVDVDLLDELMRQVGELVLVRNQIAQLAGFDSGDLLRSSQRLSLIASELQDGVMKTRMQPIEHIWSKMPRVVRDLAASCGREVRLEMIGGDTELDRSLLESVKDPLTHLVRNAVDHGIEDPDLRQQTGKTRVGTLVLRAYHAGGQVVVEVTDDGAGIDPSKVGAKALERGLKTKEQLALMSANEIQNLVFMPGFSTAAKVTNVSGRGVGMDVVRSNIEEIGGSVEVESEVGKGTTWRLYIPLTLAIMPALTVQSGDEIYAIPQLNLLELVALDPQKTQDSIEHIGNSEVYRLRGSLLPLVRLSSVLGGETDEQTTSVIAVLSAENQRFGLVIDRVLNNEEIVVKPIATALRNIGIYAGATLMGDGQVALILDVQAIARRELKAETTEMLAQQLADQLESGSDESIEHLVVRVGANRRVAIPLADVTRLEQVAVDRMESVGGRTVVQYRDAIVPVLRLPQMLGVCESNTGEELPVVIFTRGSKTIAVVVDEILEIINDSGAVRSPVQDSGLLGSVVLSGQVTELLDVRSILLSADPNFFDEDWAINESVQESLVGA
jgi:two-component system chemotaxis sensor kinase CheA